MENIEMVDRVTNKKKLADLDPHCLQEIYIWIQNGNINPSSSSHYFYAPKGTLGGI